MNQSYSKYVSTFKKLYVAAMGKKPKTKKDCLDFFYIFEKEVQNQAIKLNESCIYKQFFCDTVLHIMWYYNKSTKHYFLEEGLSDFLSSSVKKLSKDYFVHSSFDIDKNKIRQGLVQLKDIDYHDAIFIHLPSKESNLSIAVLPRPFMNNPINNINETFLLYCTDMENIAFESIYLDENCDKNAFFDSKYNSDEHTLRMRKIVYGLSLYIDAFPDVIKEVNGIKQIGHYKGNRSMVVKNNVLKCENEHSVSPHFRRGHFRVLSSDKFKKARGKTIFINGCFVKGKAFDVLADDKEHNDPTGD